MSNATPTHPSASATSDHGGVVRTCVRATQAVCPAFEVVPVGQAAHDAPPGFALTVPVGHGAQLDEPVAEKAPAGQAWQVAAPSPENVPAGQAEQRAEPAAEDDPAAHALQAALPALGWKNPGAHDVQAPRPGLGAIVPAWQARHVAAPGLGATKPAGHARQVICPALGWASPAGQTWQGAWPVVENCPGAHACAAAGAARRPIAPRTARTRASRRRSMLGDHGSNR